MTESEIIQQLFHCAATAGNSEHKRSHLIELPKLIIRLAKQIASQTYQPQPFTVFAVTDPKLREIFAPTFSDRLVQQWLVSHIESWFDKRFIDDSYANRTGKGTHAAIARLQRFTRQPGHRWYCKLDIQAFFPSIDRSILLGLWQDELFKLPFESATLLQLNHVATAIINQSPIDPPPQLSGDIRLLKQIPTHKSLYHARPGIGLPIGSLTSQFFANVYLDKLDQFVKHQLKVKGYLRYVDDFILLGDNPDQLNEQRQQVESFLSQYLHLRLHPNKVVLQRCNQGIDYLGSIVYPNHRLIRQRSVKALRRRLRWFFHFIEPETYPSYPPPMAQQWAQWMANHELLRAPGIPSIDFLQRMLSTINSYYGQMTHANTYRLRKHIYHKELGPLKQFFLPANGRYSHLTIRKTCLLEY